MNRALHWKRKDDKSKFYQPTNWNTIIYPREGSVEAAIGGVDMNWSFITTDIKSKFAGLILSQINVQEVY